MSIAETVAGINKRHEVVIKQRALVGNLRAIALTWQREVQAKFKMEVTGFTARERGNIQDLLQRHGTDTTIALIEWAVARWKTLSEAQYMKLPPMPVFADFYFNRDRILAAWEESKKTKYVVLKAPEKKPEIEQPSSGKTLKDFIEAERIKRGRQGEK